MSDLISRQDAISITWSDNTQANTRRYCKKSGYLCEFASEYGYCQITVSVKDHGKEK